jgi:hypothetical protein
VPAATTQGIAAALDDYRNVHPRPKNGLTWSLYETVGALCRNRKPGTSKIASVVDGLPGAPSDKTARKYVRNAEALGIDCD